MNLKLQGLVHRYAEKQCPDGYKITMCGIWWFRHKRQWYMDCTFEEYTPDKRWVDAIEICQTEWFDNASQAETWLKRQLGEVE